MSIDAINDRSAKPRSTKGLSLKQLRSCSYLFGSPPISKHSVRLAYADFIGLADSDPDEVATHISQAKDLP